MTYSLFLNFLLSKRKGETGMKKRAVFFLLLCLLLLALGEGLPVRAADGGFRFTLGEAEGQPGDDLQLTLSYDGSLGELGAFAVRVEFDPQAFEYLRVRPSPAVRDAYHLTACEDGLLLSNYVLKASQGGLSGPSEPFTFLFRVREGAEPGEKSFLASVYDVVSPVPEPLEGGAEEEVPYAVLPPPREEAFLLSLTPSAGSLEPAFSQDCAEYAVTVPFSVTSMTFAAKPAQGAVCKVNRKNLGAGGSDTLFLLTVTAEDQKTKEQYRVTVHRQEKPPPSPSPDPVSTAAPTPAAAPTDQPETQETPGPTPGPSLAPTASAAPVAAAQETPAPSPPPARESGPSRSSPPGLIIQNGTNSVLPILLSALLLLAAAVLSGPLSRWLCARLPEREKKDKKK